MVENFSKMARGVRPGARGRARFFRVTSILARAEAAAPADEAYRRAILVRGPGTFVFDGLTDSLLLSVLGAVFPVSQRLALRAVGSLARRGAVPDPSPSPASRRA